MKEIASVVAEISSLVSKMAGIQLGAKQAPMVESRLRSRMVRLGIQTPAEYLAHLNAHMEEESQALLSLLTTHHTFFFREFNHFEFLLNRGLPVAIECARQRGDKKIRIWSAASSRGQEAYSLAMFMKFHLAASAPDIDFEIWGTDVDPESVRWAQNGVYQSDELKQAPAMYLDGNWIKGKGDVANFSKIRDALKAKCKFQTANLFALDSFLKDKSFDIIFCRNVFIYFDANQIKQCTTQILKHLDPSGFLFLGVSESLHGLNMPVENSGASIYRHPQKTVAGRLAARAPAPTPLVAVESGPRRVFCVDDSPTILALLKKILVPANGFEVVGTAKNGKEALEQLRSAKVDIITLDLHMPEMDGLGFLQNFKNPQIPVVVVSAINRDDVSIAQKALALGASDYVEKPSLENIAQATNEISSKLKTCLALHRSKISTSAPNTATSTARAATGAPTTSAPPATRTSPPRHVPSAPAKPAARMAPVAVATEKKRKKKVMIVDDSATIRQLLEKIISQDPELEIVAKAERPSEVEDLIKKHSPDVITLDIHMPEMDGVTLLRKIQPRYQIPTVMISSISKEEGPQVLQALEIGAIDYIQKPQMSDMAEVAPMIREKLKIAAQVTARSTPIQKRKAPAFSAVAQKNPVLLGASTGGTEALRTILESLPAQIPPILIVQHIPAGFSAAFARLLNDSLPFEVREARDGDEVLPNLVLIAPGGTQMGLRNLKDKLVVSVNDDAPVNRHKPSVDYLFHSAVRLGLKKSVAAIMTGMGADGAAGMKALRDIGVRTIAQDRATSIVYGMPREAFERGGAEVVRPLGSIAETIVQLAEEIIKEKTPKSA